MSDGMDARLWIGNPRVDAASGRTFDTVNPATGESMASVAEDAEAALDEYTQTKSVWVALDR